MKTIDINVLPEDLQTKIRSTLTCYDRAYVERENGKYTYCAGLCLDTRVKAPDFATFEITKDAVYSPEEQAANRLEQSKYNWEAMNC